MLDKDKYIIITGANGNLGFYISNLLLSQGFKCILFYHKSNENIVKLKEKYSFLEFSLDLSSYEEIKNIFQDIHQRNIGYLIHTASVRSIYFDKLADSKPENWKEIFNQNLFGTYNILHNVIPIMRKNKFGKIILLGTNVTRIGLPHGSAYASAKSAIVNLCRTIAIEEAENNILINTISPGPIKIDSKKFSPEYQKFRENYYNEQLKKIPLKRIATIEEIANICLFYLSEKNSYITGEEIFVTGGTL